VHNLIIFNSFILLNGREGREREGKKWEGRGRKRKRRGREGRGGNGKGEGGEREMQRSGWNNFPFTPLSSNESRSR